MQSMTPPRSDRRPRSFIIATALGGCLAVAGLVIAFLSLETPFASSLVPGSRPGAPITPIIWALALVAGGALLVAGTTRLAAVAADLRAGRRPESPLAEVLGSLPPDMTPASDVVPT